MNTPDLLRSKNDNPIEIALSCLRAEKIIICPSESSYSVSCDARSEKAVEKIREIKKDKEFKPMTILVSDLKQVEEFGILNDNAKRIAKKLMPGQINLIIEKRNDSEYNFLSRAEEGIAFRIPKNKVMLEIIQKLGAPITTTSVNFHGQPAMYKIGEIKRLFQDKVCAIINAGDLDESIPASTIYDTRTGRILRQGIISAQEILKN